MQQPVTTQPGYQPADPSAPPGYPMETAPVQPPMYPAVPVQPTQQVSNTTTVVMVNQPTGPTQRSWSSGLCGCFEDFGSCCLGLFCPMCLLMDVSQTAGEGCCFAYCCPQQALLTLRVKIRVENQIQGSLCDDWCAVCCCPVCVMCQLSREQKYVKRSR